MSFAGTSHERKEIKALKWATHCGGSGTNMQKYP